MIIYLQVEVERVTGKFASRDATYEALAAEIEGASLSVDDSEYEVVSVSEYAPPKPERRKKAAPA